MFTMFFPHSVCVYLLSDWELFGLLSIEWNSDFHTSPWWLQSDGGVWVAVPAASSRGPTRWRLMKKYPLLRLLSNSGQLKYSSFLVLFLSCKEYIIRKLSSLCGNHWTVMPGSLWPHSGWGSVMDSYCSSLVGEQIHSCSNNWQHMVHSPVTSIYKWFYSTTSVRQRSIFPTTTH